MMLGVSKKLSLIIAIVGQINKFVEWGHDCLFGPRKGVWPQGGCTRQGSTLLLIN